MGSKFRICENGLLCPCEISHSKQPVHLGRDLSWESKKNSYPTEKGDATERGMHDFLVSRQVYSVQEFLTMMREQNLR